MCIRDRYRILDSNGVPRRPKVRGVRKIFVTIEEDVAAIDVYKRQMQKFVNIATDTLFADGANVAGFMFKNNVLKFHNDEGETLLINGVTDRKSTRLNSSHSDRSRMPSSA